MQETTPPAAPLPDQRDEARRTGDETNDTDPRLDRLLAFETILEHSPLNVLIFDRDGIVREASKAASEASGIPRDRLRGRSLRQHLPAELQEKIGRTLAGEALLEEEKVLSHSAEHNLWTTATWVPIRAAGGAVAGGLLIVVDNTAQQLADDRVEELAFFDPVTELPNGALLMTMLQRALVGAKAKRRQLALMWLNIDRFKDVNDALGQAVGDRLLRAVGDRLVDALRSNDTVACLGSDEFLLLLARVNSPPHLERLIARVRAVFLAPFLIDKETIYLTVSGGVAVHPDGGASARQLQENAHTAMRAAKDRGGNYCQLFEASADDESGERYRLASAIRDGMAGDEFELHYQPQIELASGRIVGLEALARWQHPQRGLLGPAEFIPFAEESGLIVALGRGLLAQACAQLRSWTTSLASPPRLAFNISAREFQRSDLCAGVKRAAAAAGIAPELLEVEITETAVLVDPLRAVAVAKCLQAAGVSVALDDFGTGFSSLTHLREMPIDRVKIDRSFVGNCLGDPTAAAIIESVTALAHRLGLEVVAEGVESEEHLEFIRAAGCDIVQGHQFAPPLPPLECEEFLRAWARRPVADRYIC